VTESDQKRSLFAKAGTNKKRWMALGLAVVLIGGGSAPSRH